MKPLPGYAIQFRTEEVSLGSKIGRLFASILDFKTWSNKVEWNLVMIIEKGAVHVKSAPEKEGSTRIPITIRLELSVLVQVLVI